MRNITEELAQKDCVICMHCGRIYEGATIAEHFSSSCECGKGWFNWVVGGFDKTFWGSDAERNLHEYGEVKFKRR